MTNSNRILVFLVVLAILLGSFPECFSVEVSHTKGIITQGRQIPVLTNSAWDQQWPLDNQINGLDNTLLVFIVPLLILDVLASFVAGFVFVWTHYSVFLAVLSVISGLTLVASVTFWLQKRKYYRKHAILKGWKLGWLLGLLVVYIANLVLTLIVALKDMETLIYVLTILDFVITLVIGYLAYVLSLKAKKKLEGFIPRLN